MRGYGLASRPFDVKSGTPARSDTPGTSKGEGAPSVLPPDVRSCLVENLASILFAAYQERCADSCVFEATVSPPERLPRTDSRDTDKTHLKGSTNQNEMSEKLRDDRTILRNRNGLRRIAKRESQIVESTEV